MTSDDISLNSSLPSMQWGCQPGKLTVQALMATTDNWLQCLERGNDTGAVFFDFKKAFDSVPHMALISILQQLNVNLTLFLGCKTIRQIGLNVLFLMVFYRSTFQ